MMNNALSLKHINSAVGLYSMRMNDGYSSSQVPKCNILDTSLPTQAALSHVGLRRQIWL